FFFSSRRRHTRSKRDWSSDVCSSDLLQLAAMTADKPLDYAEIYRTFPRLDERRYNRGRELSGGEQQMVAIARAMIRDARLIFLEDRKSTRLNSSHVSISYAVFCLKKK